MRHLGVLALVFSIGCADEQSPTQSMSPVAPALQEFRLSGGVRDSAFRPLSGATVEIASGPGAGMVAITDEAGRFSMPGTVAANVTVAASKDGYLRETRPLIPVGRSLPPGGGRMEIYFSLEPATPSADIAGVYSVTLTASNSCKLPDRALTRRYTATIASSGRPTSFLATLSDARFFSTLPCPSGRPPDSCTHNRFGIGIAGDYGDIGVGIVEQLDETSYLVVEAGGDGTFSANGITVPLSGALRYCPSEPHWTSGEYWDCEGGIQCDAQDHQLALIRR